MSPYNPNDEFDIEQMEAVYQSRRVRGLALTKEQSIHHRMKDANFLDKFENRNFQKKVDVAVPVVQINQQLKIKALNEKDDKIVKDIHKKQEVQKEQKYTKVNKFLKENKEYLGKDVGTVAIPVPN